MDLKEFSEEMCSKMNKIGIKLNEEQINLFYQYMNLLIEWNQRINLTAIVDPKEIIIKHFVDCATIYKDVRENERLIDIGTGAGFPGIPLKILDDNIEITLVDSLNKRVIFLEEVIKVLKLKNISAIHSRVEDLAMNKKHRENYDVVSSRAVAPLNTLLEYMLPFIKIKGKAISMKGSNIKEELESSKKALKVLGGRITTIEQFELLDTDMKRSIVIIEKEKETPKEYPRQAGKPSKTPII